MPAVHRGSDRIAADRALFSRARREPRAISCSASATMRRCCACRPAASSCSRPMRWSRACISCPARRARSLGHRALAVNLSDIAAMGASPSWALLSLNLPAADEGWLREFAAGFGALARASRRRPGGRQPEPRAAVDHGRAGRDWSRADRRCDATARAPAMNSTSAAARAMRPAASSCCSGEARAAHGRCGAICGSGSSTRRRASHWGRRCAAWRAPASMSPTGCTSMRCACCAASGCGATLEIERLPLSAPLRRVLGDRAWQTGAVRRGGLRAVLHGRPGAGRGRGRAGGRAPDRR